VEWGKPRRLWLIARNGSDLLQLLVVPSAKILDLHFDALDGQTGFVWLNVSIDPRLNSPIGCVSSSP